MDDIYTAFEKARGAVYASEEDWPQQYHDTPVPFGKMLRLTGRLERQILQHFKDMAANHWRFINWYAYGNEVRADVNVDVIINDDELDNQQSDFIKIIFDTVAAIQALGADAAQQSYGIVLGLDSTSTIIQKLTTDQLANLVGKTVDKSTGRLVDNPKAGMSIDGTTRDRIAQSIKTSVRLGETRAEASLRLQNVIANPTRAQLIARTEAVRAYGIGRNGYAKASGAVAKKWITSNATDICADDEAQGMISIDQDFVSGDEHEPAHPNCKCIVVYSYEPLDNIDE